MNSGYQTAEEKIECAIEKKQAGNDFFKAGETQKAIKRYVKILKKAFPNFCTRGRRSFFACMP